MLLEFQKYIKDQGLFRHDQRVLLAVSGGIDSMVMADLFLRSGLDVGFAHCNFHLRGAESNKDQDFVKSLAGKHKVPFYTIGFQTETYARDHGISIQMAARELRYNWLEKIVAEEGFDFYATAHHLDDQIETFFINLLRGTGIQGLHGIQAISGKCIRPLLFATRKAIEKYNRDNQLAYREDASNKSLKYLRNKIRHRLLPAIEGINPAFRNVFSENFQRFIDAERIYRREMELTRLDILEESEEEETTRILIDDLFNLHPLRTYLYELLSPFNFNRKVVEDIIMCLDDIPGKQFYSISHRLIKDRDHLIISALDKKPQEREYLVGVDDALITDPLDMVIIHEDITKDFTLPDENHIACLDLNKLSFPLKLRRWRTGDEFRPLGMERTKKLSDFFIDEKFSLFEKESTWILQSGDDICWIVGHRIDDRFKITSATLQIVRFEHIH